MTDHFIPPDYEEEFNVDDEGDTDIDEGKEETIIDTELQMTAPPFSSIPPGNPSSSPSWGIGNQSQQKTFSWQQAGSHQWGNNNNGWKPPTPGSTPSWGGSNSQVMPLNRDKKVIFIDFLDCIAETFNSNQIPGYLPRDIYDITPRFDVWQKLAAINPERVYILIPRNLLPTTNGARGWEAALTYYCCSLSSFLRVPFTNCQVLVQSVIGQPKEDIMLSVIENKERPIDRKIILSIGIYSGQNGQSDIDKIAADRCGIDFIDLPSLLKMI